MNGIQFGWYTVYMDNKVVNSLITSRNSKIPFSSSCLSQENEADGEKEKENKSKLTNRIEKKSQINYRLQINPNSADDRQYEKERKRKFTFEIRLLPC